MGRVARHRGVVNVRTGNPAVLGTYALRPEALRPHLSVSLPKNRPVLCSASGNPINGFSFL